jgi:hypothetical protein
VCTCTGVSRFDIQQLEQLIVAAERFLPAWSVNLHVTLFQLVPEAAQKRPLMAHIRSVIETFAPIDVLVATPDDIADQRNEVGSIMYWLSREGKSVYRRLGIQADLL